MTLFIIICLAICALISVACWADDRAKREKPQPEPMAEYEAFEATARELIEVMMPSRDEREKLMRQFYTDHPPPYLRQCDVERALKEAGVTKKNGGTWLRVQRRSPDRWFRAKAASAQVDNVCSD